MTTIEYLQGNVYLTVRKAEVGYWRTELRPVKATYRKPTVVDADEIVVKVQLRIPAAAFEPLEPEAVVTVPEELVQHPVYVEAVASDG